MIRNRSLGKRNKLSDLDPAIWMFFIYIFLFISFYKIAPSIIAPLTFGWYLSLIIDVPARFLFKVKIIPYKLAVVLSSILMFGLLLFCVISLAPIVIDEGGAVVNSLADFVVNIELPSFLKDSKFSAEITKMLEDSAGKLINILADTGFNVLNAVVVSLPSFLTGAVLFFVAAAYFTSLVPKLRKNLWRFFPRSSADKAIMFLGEFYREIRNFIGGQMLIAACIGLLVGLGFFILGLPYPLFLGFLSGITNFIPYLGSIIAMVPSLLLGFTSAGLPGAIKAAAVLLAANQIEAWLLSPKIQGKRMKINWFAILVGMFFFGKFFGILGVLLSIPIIAFIRKFWIEYIQKAFRRL